MKKSSIVVMFGVLLLGLLLEGCQQPTGACVIELGCMDDETEGRCTEFVDGDFYEGLSCTDLGYDGVQSRVRGILRP